MRHYLLLDRSGSMQTLWDEAVNAINVYVNKQKKRDKIYLAVFDSISYDVLRDIAVSKYQTLSIDEAHPRASTPLYDSAAKLLDKAIADNPKKAVIVIMTDGYENMSREHNQTTIKAKIAQAEERGWQVVFLGANFDQIEQQATMMGAGAQTMARSMYVASGQLAATMDCLGTYATHYNETNKEFSFTMEDRARAAGDKVEK